MLVNGEEHPVQPGTTVYVGPWAKHKIVNDSQADLKMLWVLLPGGLEDFFQAIGRPRRPGALAVGLRGAETASPMTSRVSSPGAAR